MTCRALVIGASGGIGSAISHLLSARGSSVTNLSRSAQGFDLTDPEAVEYHLGNINGTFDTIIVATGILSAQDHRPEKCLTEINAVQMAHVLAVNAIGPALVLRHLPSLLHHKSRAVVGVLTARVGSIGDNNLGGWYSYRAAKAAANQIVRTAALEITRKRPKAIVVAIHPGTVETAFTSAYKSHAKVTPKNAANNLLSVLDSLTPAQNGGFFDSAGRPVKW
jgi:NAD(P)-dependent dehydrogenase (short-subunit alcohol dehydrogenase family)